MMDGALKLRPPLPMHRHPTPRASRPVEIRSIFLRGPRGALEVGPGPHVKAVANGVSARSTSRSSAQVCRGFQTGQFV